MKTITKSVIKLSELPKHLQENKIFAGHKIHTFAEFHINNFERDELTLWLIEKYPTIKMKISFLIHIDMEKQQQGYSEEDMKLAFKAGHKKGFSGYPNTENWKELPFKEWFEQLNQIKHK